MRYIPLNYDIHWRKTMSDIRFLQIKGCKLIPQMLSDLREHWVKVHGEQHRTDFEVKPGAFFDDRVKRKTNHDDLHKMINPNPTYLKMIINDVNPDKELFFNLSEFERKEVLFEEAFVISFLNHNLFVLLEGTYSSWDSPYWDSVSLAIPYEYTETRYRAASLSDIRDIKIDSVIDDEKQIKNLVERK